MVNVRLQQTFGLFLLGGLVCMIAFSTIRSRLQSSFLLNLPKMMDVEMPSMTCTRSPDPMLICEPAPSDLPSLLNINIETTSEGLATRRFTSVDLVKAYLARIEEASYFKAVLQTNPDALTAAQELDDERIQSGSRGYGRCSSSFRIITY